MADERVAKQAKTEDNAVTVFREYLRIKTVQPNPDYEGAVQFFSRISSELGLTFKCIESSSGKLMAVIMTWNGLDVSLPSILLNSHIDVVPVFEEHWKYDPFSAHKTENGDIYARGSQDMKCVGIQYIEAIRRLKSEDKRFARTIRLSFVPDEEIGGTDGMALLVKQDDFKSLNIGFALDEGLANPTEAFTVFYGERAPWWVKVNCPGKPGHGSRFVEDSAAEKLHKVMASFLNFRAAEKEKLESNPELKLGDVTTVNCNIVEGGVQPNVVPSIMSAVFDCRITPTMDLKKFEAQIEKWCKEAGSDVTYEFLTKFDEPVITSTSDDDPWWKAFSSVCNKMKLKIEKEIFPAATDSRFLRAAGYPAIGFSPMNKTPILLHDHNEYLNENVFLNGIDIYCELIEALATVPAF